MTRNIGNEERIIRAIGGIAIIGSGFFFGSWLGLIGLLPLATAAVGSCGLYSLLGINTCPVPVRHS